jgi:hypothetical protein
MVQRAKCRFKSESYGGRSCEFHNLLNISVENWLNSAAKLGRYVVTANGPAF